MRGDEPSVPEDSGSKNGVVRVEDVEKSQRHGKKTGSDNPMRTMRKPKDAFRYDVAALAQCQPRHERYDSRVTLSGKR